MKKRRECSGAAEKEINVVSRVFFFFLMDDRD